MVTYGQLEQDCLGAWCPVRRIPGLILIHAWNPNDMNTLTSVCAILILRIAIHLIIPIIVIILIPFIIITIHHYHTLHRCPPTITFLTNNQCRIMLSAILCGQQLTQYLEEGERRWLKK